MRLMRRLVTAVVAGALVMVPATMAQGAQGGGGPGGGPGSGQGGGGKGGGGNSGGNSGQANNPKGNLYSDLWVIARDNSGVPITVDLTDAEDATVTCVQPITFAKDTGFTELTDTDSYPYAETAYLVPLAGSDPDQMVTLGLEPCEVLPDSAGYVSEVDLGRLNLGRSPERVLSKQLGDVELFLAGGEASLDASGRLVVNGVALDSPLANLAAYQSILEMGTIGTMDVPDVALDGLPLTAAMLAAGSPKESFEITVDTVQYLNRILDIPADTTAMATVPTPGTSATGEYFLDYSEMPGYQRSGTFKGCVVYNDPENGLQETRAYLEDVVGFQGAAGMTHYGIDAYVQLAEDARDVLVWVHDMGILVQHVDSIMERTEAFCPSE